MLSLSTICHPLLTFSASFHFLLLILCPKLDELLQLKKLIWRKAALPSRIEEKSWKTSPWVFLLQGLCSSIQLISNVSALCVKQPIETDTDMLSISKFSCSVSPAIAPLTYTSPSTPCKNSLSALEHVWRESITRNVRVHAYGQHLSEMWRIRCHCQCCGKKTKGTQLDQGSTIAKNIKTGLENQSGWWSHTNRQPNRHNNVRWCW